MRNVFASLQSSGHTLHLNFHCLYIGNYSTSFLDNFGDFKQKYWFCLLSQNEIEAVILKQPNRAAHFYTINVNLVKFSLWWLWKRSQWCSDMFIALVFLFAYYLLYTFSSAYASIKLWKVISSFRPLLRTGKKRGTN